MSKFYSIFFLILAFPTISLGWPDRSDSEFRNAQDNHFGTIPYINELRKKIEDLEKYKEEKIKRTWLIDGHPSMEDNEKDTIILNLKKELERIKSNSMPSMEDNEKDSIISKLKKELEDIKKEGIQNILRLKNEINEKESENFKLRNKTDNQLTDLLRDLKDRNDSLSSLKNWIAKAEKKSQEDEKTISGLKNWMAKAEKKFQEDEKTISGLKNWNAKAEKKSQEDKKTLSSLENEIANARMKSQEDEKKFNDTVLLDQNIINEIRQDLDQSKKNEALAKQKSKELENLIDGYNNSLYVPLMVGTSIFFILILLFFIKNKSQKKKIRDFLREIQFLKGQIEMRDESIGTLDTKLEDINILKQKLEFSRIEGYRQGQKDAIKAEKEKHIIWEKVLDHFSDKISNKIVEALKNVLGHYPLSSAQIETIKKDVEEQSIKIKKLEVKTLLNDLKNDPTTHDDFVLDDEGTSLHLIKSANTPDDSEVSDDFEDTEDNEYTDNPNNEPEPNPIQP